MNPPRTSQPSAIWSHTAWDLMSSPIVTVRDDQTVREAARTLLEHRIQGAPVVDASGAVVGVVSVAELARPDEKRGTGVAPDSDYYNVRDAERSERFVLGPGESLENPEDSLVRDVMDPTVVAVGETASLADIVRTLVRRRVHRAMVVRSQGGAPIGVVSETDVLRTFLSVLQGGEEE